MLFFMTGLALIGPMTPMPWLEEYLQSTTNSLILPKSLPEFDLMLDVHVLKVVCRFCVCSVSFILSLIYSLHFTLLHLTVSAD